MELDGNGDNVIIGAVGTIPKRLVRGPEDLEKRRQEDTIEVNKVANVVDGDSKAPFWLATTPRCRGGCNSYPWIAPL